MKPAKRNLGLEVLEGLQELKRGVHGRKTAVEKVPGWEAAWSAEADRREDRIARGEANWASGPEAVARIRAKIS
ncbi:MAG: hypothetical protein ABIQ86_14700 [Steroidobacteraceae bacterium]